MGVERKRIVLQSTFLNIDKVYQVGKVGAMNAMMIMMYSMRSQVMNDNSKEEDDSNDRWQM